MAHEYERQGLTKKEYEQIHSWLKGSREKGDTCLHCKKTGLKLQNALIAGFKYEKKADNFISLCHKCHSAYDIKFARLMGFFPRKYTTAARGEREMTRAQQTIYDFYQDQLTGKRKSRVCRIVSEKSQIPQQTVLKYLNGNIPNFDKALLIVKALKSFTMEEMQIVKSKAA